MKNDKYVSSNMTGYIVSLYIPGKESEYCPIRYNMVRDLENISEGLNVNYQSDEGLEKYFLSDNEGYELLITGSALGSRSYSLYGTYNGGETWNIINEDPFNGDMGTADGMTFINEKLGFYLCQKAEASMEFFIKQGMEEIHIQKLKYPQGIFLLSTENVIIHLFFLKYLMRKMEYYILL